jgi:5-methylcytosine-specific restriction endonuclease McrA
MDTTNLPKTRAEAKASGAKYYFTGEPCKHGHVAPRKTKGACLECLKLEWEQGNVKRAEYFANYNRSEAGKNAKKQYYAKNRDMVIARAQARPDQDKRQYQQRYQKANPELYKVNTSFRRRRFREATPKWLSPEQKLEIKLQYRLAIELSRRTKIRYVVDHVVPLQGETVCGLHVPWNLEVITQEQNLKKSNLLPTDEEALAFPQKR